MSGLYQYATAVHLYKPIIKRGVIDFAVGADWTPAAGDVKISIDGAAAANVTNLPVAIVMGNTAMWDYSLTSGELTGKKIRISVADAATKAVEDTFFEIDTYGNASAQHAVNLNDVVRAGLTALPNVASGSAGAIPTTGTGSNQLNVSAGIVDANVKQVLGTAAQPRYTGTAQAGTGPTITLAAGTTSLQCGPGDLIVLTGGTGQGQSGYVQSTSGMGTGTPIVTMALNWLYANPDSSTTYEIMKIGELVPLVVTSVAGRPDVNIGSVHGTVVNGAGTSGSPWGP